MLSQFQRLTYVRPNGRCPFWLIVLCSILTQATIRADDRLETTNAARICGEFSIATEGRLILLPVRLEGQDYKFMLDTGACRSAFDIRFADELGKPKGLRTLLTAAGPKRVQIYDWPDATLAGQPIRTGHSVACMDFAAIRQAVGEQIDGVIGMDVLRNCRMLLDFERGKIRFVESLPTPVASLGARVPVDFSPDGTPMILGFVADDSSERFLIDTGAHGNSLRSQIFDELVEQNRISLSISFTSVTAGGEMQGSRGRLLRLSIGPINQDRLRMARLGLSTLGLRYLSRFDVAFDFPDHAIYLRKGTHFLKPEPQATSGMALNWVDGKVLVMSIKKGGSAAIAGVRPNDEIIEVDDKSASEYDHFSLRQLLTSCAAKVVSLRIRRHETVFLVKLSLDED